VVFRFGPAGKPYGFKGDMIKAVNYVRKEGLNAMEYEAVRGVNIKEDKAKALGEEAMKLDVKLSLHAPYYINLSSEDEKVLKGSVRRLVDALKASEWMGAYVVVYHPGYYKGLPREEAVRKVVNALKEVWNEARSFGVRNVWLGPETTGKTSQVGSLEDIVEICSSSEKCRPVVDWAHLHARSRGEYITSIDDVIQVIEFLEKNLGREALKPLHQHFSKIAKVVQPGQGIGSDQLLQLGIFSFQFR